MIRVAALALVAAPLVAVPVLQPAHAQANPLQQAQAHLRAVDTMVADFSQTDRAGKVLTGVLTLKKPGKIRFQYQRGVPILIVSDGRALWFIDYSVNQEQRWPIRNSPLAILLDPEREIEGIARVVPSGDPRIILVEASDPKRPEYGRISMAFAVDPASPAGLILQGWVATDSQNNRTTVRLKNQRFNISVDDRTFTWNPIRGRTRR